MMNCLQKVFKSLIVKLTDIQQTSVKMIPATIRTMQYDTHTKKDDLIVL